MKDKDASQQTELNVGFIERRVKGRIERGEREEKTCLPLQKTKERKWEWARLVS